MRQHEGENEGRDGKQKEQRERERERDDDALHVDLAYSALHFVVSQLMKRERRTAHTHTCFNSLT